MVAFCQVVDSSLLAGYEPEGREFDSLRARHCLLTLKAGVKMSYRFLRCLALCLLFGLPCWAEQVIRTFAGRTWTFDVNNVPALDAPLGTIFGLTIDATGSVFAADPSNHIVVKVLRSGMLQVVAGNGSPGFSGDGGPATAASLNAPHGLEVDAQGNLYVADTGNRRVRKVTPEEIGRAHV